MQKVDTVIFDINYRYQCYLFNVYLVIWVSYLKKNSNFYFYNNETFHSSEQRVLMVVIFLVKFEVCLKNLMNWGDEKRNNLVAKYESICVDNFVWNKY